MTRLACLAFLLSPLAVSCVRNPATGQRELMLVSEQQEINMGKEADPEVIATYGLYPDSNTQRYVRSIGEKLAALSERPNLPWTFRVVDDPVVNAFALPGGFVYVTRGILAYFNSEAELASVLGHEIGHVTARHSAHQMSQQQLAQVGLVAGMILVPKAQDFAGLAQASLGLLFLKFSRDDEQQADELGLRYMNRAKYDPREMPKVFAMLSRVSQASGGDRLPEWLATHPNPENREEHISEMIAALPQDFSGRTVNHDGYIRRLDGMVFGANPREGFFQGTLFRHPDLRFQVQFPQGWQTSNQRSAVLAQSPAQDALMQITMAQEDSPDRALSAFLSGQNISGGARSGGTINGLQAAAAPFQASTQQGVLAGSVTFVAYNGQVYRLLAYAPQDRWPAYQSVARSWAGTFERLTDSQALAVQPLKLTIVSVDHTMPLAQFQQGHASRVTVDLVARLNQLDETAQLAAGQLAKGVVGGPLPEGTQVNR